MKVNATASQNVQGNKEAQKLALQKKLAAKFGDKAMPKKSPVVKEDKLELSDSAKKKAHIDPEGFGDIKNNSPTSQETRDKLKYLLKSGSFKFSDKERSALGDILK